MIIGIALVVDELHKGQRLVYRYPESVPSSVLNSTEGLLKFHRDYQSLRCHSLTFVVIVQHEIELFISHVIYDLMCH